MTIFEIFKRTKPDNRFKNLREMSAKLKFQKDGQYHSDRFKQEVK